MMVFLQVAIRCSVKWCYPIPLIYYFSYCDPSVIKHEFEPHYVPCTEMAMLMVVFCLVVRKGLTCFSVWSYVILFLITLPSLASVLGLQEGTHHQSIQLKWQALMKRLET